MKYNTILYYIRRVVYSVMSEGLRLLGSVPRFVTSDSSPVGLRFLSPIQGIAGSNNQNTYQVRRVGPLDQALSFLKANGAGSMTPKRSRQRDLHSDVDYFRVGGGVSNE